jgi:hypothetical protein
MSYCVKTILFVINMELYRDALVQQVIKKIGDILNIYSFECTWKKFDICAIVIPNYEHTHSVHYILIFDI